MHSMQKKCTIIVSGAVQGIGFRYYTQECARELGLAGFVRNERDGAVRIEAQGDEASIREFIAWCENGPVYAQVDAVKVTWGDAQRQYQDFTIQR